MRNFKRSMRSIGMGLGCLIFVAAMITGCAAKEAQSKGADPLVQYESINKQIEVKGIAIGMTEASLTKALGDGEKENCVYGYELNYVDQNLSIGVNTSGWVRRIKTSDAETAIYGIKPGEKLDEAIKALKSAGYAQVAETKKFEKEGIRVELLSKENKLADQISIEIIEK